MFQRAFLLCALFCSSVFPATAQEKSTKPKRIETPPRLRELDFAPFADTMDRFSDERSTSIGKLLASKTIIEIQAALKSGQATSEELTLYFLKRIKQHDGTLRSYIEINPECLKEAKQADQRRAAGQSSGAMDGIPLNLKDNIDTKTPLHTTGGAEILLNHVPKSDAPIVNQLRNAGGIILGKASLSEFAGAVTSEPTGFNAVSGIGVNPYGAQFSVYGSSSGSAISTSAYLTLVSVGTETSGSLIAPAAINGVVSMKPSLELVATDGIIPLIRFQDSAGPVARNVTDAAVLLDVIDNKSIDYASQLSANSLEGVKVGLLRKDIVAKDWLPVIEAGLQKAKAIINEAKLVQKTNLLPMIFLGFSEDTLGYVRQSGGQIDSIAALRKYNLADPMRRIPRGQNFIDFGTSYLTKYLEQKKLPEDAVATHYSQLAIQERYAAHTELKQSFHDSDSEILVSLCNTHSEAYATAGYPAITIPLGLNAKGEPNGVTFIGKQNEDAKLLNFAFAFEQATRHRAEAEKYRP